MTPSIKNKGYHMSFRGHKLQNVSTRTGTKNDFVSVTNVSMLKPQQIVDDEGSFTCSTVT